MRNLKKFLALVLAMMMVMGFMVTANAATTADFKDSNEVDEQFQEAMDVLVSLGIVTGTGGDKISPNVNFTRGQLAAMVYKIMTGDVDGKRADLLYMAGEDMFTDVPAGQWYTMYVNYVCEAKWLSGTSDTTFEPNRTLTLQEVVVSMAKILGMGVDTGNWQKDWLAMIVAASNNGLIEGVDSITGGAKRQVASQIMFNAMTYIPTESGKAGKPVVQWALAGVTEHFNNPTDAKSYADRNKLPEDIEIEVHTSYPNSLADDVFGLHKAEGSRDDFKRPTVAWNDSKEVPVVETILEPDAYYDNATNFFTGKVAKALSKDGSDLKIFYNGDEVDNSQWVADTTVAANQPAGMWGDENNGIPGFEIYVYGKDVIKREAFLAVVGSTVKASGNIKVSIYGVGANKYEDMEISPTDKVYDDLAAFKEGDYIAVYPTPNWNNATAQGNGDVEILEVAELEQVSGKITEVNAEKVSGDFSKWASTVELKDADSKFTEYRITQEALIIENDAANATTLTTSNVVAAIDLGATTLYLINGNILLIDQYPATQDPAAADAGYAYFYDVKEVPGNTGDSDYKWDSEGGSQTGIGGTNTIFMGRLMLGDGSTLGGKNTGVQVVIPTVGTTLSFTDYEKDLGKLVMYKHIVTNTADYYEIKPIEGVNLGGLATMAGTPAVGDTYVNWAANTNTTTPAFDDVANTDAGAYASGVKKLTITKNKSEGVMPSKIDMATLGTATAQGSNVAFDKATAIYVVKTGLNSAKQPDFDYECNVYTIETLPQDIDISRGLVTVVGDFATPATPAVNKLDGDLDGDGNLKVARAVLIVDSSVQEISTDTYFIVYNPDAPLVGLYKDKTNTTNEFWFYQFDAVVNGKYQKVLVNEDLVKSGGTMFDTDSIDVGTDNYWLGTGVGLDTYSGKTVIDNLDDADALDSDTLVLVESVTAYANGRIGVNGKVYAAGTDSWPTDWTEASSESYLVETNGKAFTYDLFAGTITEVSIEDFTTKTVADGAKYGSDVINGGIAIRDTSHKVLTALFIDLSVDPDA